MPETGPLWGFVEPMHTNEYSGLPCNCPWGKIGPREQARHNRLHKHAFIKTADAGQHLRRVFNQAKSDKKLGSPEGKKFLETLKHPDYEPYDELLPFVANAWKRGEIHPIDKWQRAGNREIPADRKHWLGAQLPDAGPRGAYGPTHGYLQHSLPQWQQWYRARQHPSRQGANIMAKDFTVDEMKNRVKQHQDDLKEKELREQYQKEMNDPRHGPIDHQFENGWSVRNLQTREALEHEGEVMSHCIGNSEDPDYRTLMENGDISVYSLRDPHGMPHGTWHTNNNHGGIAEKFGRSDSEFNPERQAMYEEWCDGHRHNHEPVGHLEGSGGYEEEEEPIDYSVDLGGVTDPDTYMRYHDEDNSHWNMYEDARNNGYNPSDDGDTDFDFHNDYKSIMHNALKRGHPQDLWDAAAAHDDGSDHLQEFEDHAQTFMPSTPKEQQNLDAWNKLAQPYYHPWTGEFEPPYAPHDQGVYHEYVDPLFTPKMVGNPDFNLDRPYNTPRQVQDGFHYNGKVSDYQGWSNWDTWHTALMMDNERKTHDGARKIVEKGGKPEHLRDYALQHVIAPYNKQQIADAQEWNTVPEDERVDHHYEDFKEKHPDSMDMLHGLVGGPDVGDTDPQLIDHDMVNWNEIHNHIKDEQEGNDEYEREHQRLQQTGLSPDWLTPGHDDSVQQMREAYYRHHGALPDEEMKAQNGGGYTGNDPRSAYRRTVTLPYERIQQEPHFPENYISLDTRNAVSNHVWDKGVQSIYDEKSQDPNYAHMDPTQLWDMAEGIHSRRPLRERDEAKAAAWNHPDVQAIWQADPNIQKIQAEGYPKRLTEHTWDVINDIHKGQAHPNDLATMQQALAQRGHPPEAIADMMKQRRYFEPETGRWIDTQPKTYNPNTVTPDNQPGDLTLPTGWTAGWKSEGIPVEEDYWRRFTA